MKVDFSVFYSQSALSTIHIDCEHTVTADLEILSMKKLSCYQRLVSESDI